MNIDCFILTRKWIIALINLNKKWIIYGVCLFVLKDINYNEVKEVDWLVGGQL